MKSQGIISTNGATLVINNNGIIVINDGGLNSGGNIIPGNGAIYFTGAMAATVSGSNVSFYDFYINKSSGAIKLLGNISIANNLNLLSNNIDLNSFNIDLGATGSLIGEGSGSHITSSSTGFVLRTATLISPSNVNPGNIGVEISSLVNLGNTIIKRSHQKQVTSTGFGINRYFDFSPTVNTALNATIKFYYLDAELNGINKVELKQWTSADNGVTWVLLGADAQDQVANFVTKNNINVLNRITLGSVINNPLPVKLLSFNGQLKNNNVLLNWSATNQVSAIYFDVQRSADGISFTSLANVPVINSNSIALYNYLDKDPFQGISYYRLKMVDKDGSFNYSQIISVNKGTYANELLKAYPNPTNGIVNVEFTSNSSTQGNLQFTDIDGKLILNKNINIEKGLNKIQYNISYLPQGSYLIKLTGLDNKTIMVIKY